MKRAFTVVEIVVALTIFMILAALILSAVGVARARAGRTQCSAQMRQIGQAIQLYSADYDGAVPPSTPAEFVEHAGESDDSWGTLLKVYLPGRSFLACPSVQLAESMQEARGEPVFSGYAYNYRLSSEVKISAPDNRPHSHYQAVPDAVLGFPSLTVTVIEARAGIIARASPDTAPDTKGEIWELDFTEDTRRLPLGAKRHNNGSNYLFADGHVKWFTPENLKTERTCDGIHPGFGL